MLPGSRDGCGHRICATQSRSDVLECAVDDCGISVAQQQSMLDEAPCLLQRRGRQPFTPMLQHRTDIIGKLFQWRWRIAFPVPRQQMIEEDVENDSGEPTLPPPEPAAQHPQIVVCIRHRIDSSMQPHTALQCCRQHSVERPFQIVTEQCSKHQKLAACCQLEMCKVIHVVLLRVVVCQITLERQGIRSFDGGLPGE